MDQKTQFIADYLRQTLDMTELCQLYGISRKTGYKWIERYLQTGPQGLEDRSRRPLASPNQTSPTTVEALLQTRQRHPTWGAKKLLSMVGKRHPDWSLPGRFNDWHKFLGDAALATAILDRLLCYNVMLEFKGKIYRLKEAANRLARGTHSG